MLFKIGPCTDNYKSHSREININLVYGSSASR